jgi:hypothetical protein
MIPSFSMLLNMMLPPYHPPKFWLALLGAHRERMSVPLMRHRGRPQKPRDRAERGAQSPGGTK